MSGLAEAAAAAVSRAAQHPAARRAAARSALAALAALAAAALGGGAVYLLAGALAPPRSLVTRELRFDYRGTGERAAALVSFLDQPTITADTPAAARAFAPGQRYAVRLELELPDSPANTAVGVFQVTAELLSADGRRAALETMPAAVPYTPPTSRLLRTLRRAPLAATGLFYGRGESEMLRLEMFRSVVERAEVPFAAMEVALEPRGGAWSAQHADVLPHVTRGEAIVELQVPLVRRLLSRFALPLAVAAAYVAGAAVFVSVAVVPLAYAALSSEGGDGRAAAIAGATGDDATSAATTTSEEGRAAQQGGSEDASVLVQPGGSSGRNGAPSAGTSGESTIRRRPAAAAASDT